MPITTLEPTPAHKRLRLFSAIAAGLGLLQLLLAVIFLATDNDLLSHVHEGVAFLMALAAILAAVPAYYWGKLSRDTGLFPHAAGVAGATIVQIVLGFVGKPHGGQPLGALIYSHMLLGVLIAVGALYLYIKARRMPIVVTNLDGTRREGPAQHH